MAHPMTKVGVSESVSQSLSQSLQSLHLRFRIVKESRTLDAVGP
jgi:hypothetical protein